MEETKGSAKGDEQQDTVVGDSVAFIKRVKAWRSRLKQSSKPAEERQKLLSNGVELQGLLQASEENMKTKMVTVNGEYDVYIQRISKVLTAFVNEVRKVRTEYRSLKAALEKIQRTAKKRAHREEALKIAVLRLEEERRQAFGTVSVPHWEVPHHFHMIALEHFRGNKQKQLTEIAELFPGHLRIAAMAKQTSLLPHRVFPQFKNSQKAKEITLKDLDVAKQRLKDKGDELEKYLSQFRLLQAALGIRRTSRSSMEESKSSDDVQTKAPPVRSNSAPRRGGSSGGSGYLNIKRRYFNALHLTKGGSSSAPSSPFASSAYLAGVSASRSFDSLLDDAKVEDPGAEVDDLDSASESESILSSTTPSSLSISLPNVLSEWEVLIADLTGTLEGLKKEKKRLKDELDRIRAARATFEAEMAQLRLLKLPSLK
eukprot:TRINITY_DN3341_c0_g1_i1.p1 TRINITY_DN3341_c0_g1~~TRINITY_DN3341_c0_g1_i1.p1  ORF type:complete len:428 (+),score=106.73 TRINITY_DN3341_c0_g1_i1:72-1355(+)